MDKVRLGIYMSVCQPEKNICRYPLHYTRGNGGRIGGGQPGYRSRARRSVFNET